MTIELGFAWVTLPSGREISIVDVPGHERFVRNMLMGVGGVDLALLIVAADEGVMPQTREHIAILDLLDIRHGIVVLTKADLVDDELIELVSAEVEEALEGASLAGSPVMAVSGETGQGVPELLALIDSRLDELPAHTDLNRPRLPVDRAFTMSGFGAVVTGTLSGGRLKVGQEVTLLPSSRTARIRGLQSHQSTLTEALPGSRVAVNMSGIEAADIARGDLLTTPGWLKPATAFDVSIRVISDAPRPIRHNHRLVLFTGSREAPVTVRILEGDEIAPGQSGWAQIKSSEPVCALKGDRFVLRDTQDTLGGGVILEPDAPRHRRNDHEVIARLETLASGSGEAMLAQALRDVEPAGTAELARAANLSEVEAASMADELVVSGAAIDIGQPGQLLLYTAQGWSALRDSAQKALSAFHAQFPLRPGMPREALRGHLKMKAAPFARVVESLSRTGDIAADASWVRLSSHNPQLDTRQQAVVDAYLRSLASEPFSPPTDSPIDTELTIKLEADGEVVRAGDVVFLASAFKEMTDRLADHVRSGGAVSINEARDLFGSSRKYVLALLEELDRRGVTVRRGDDRFIRNL
jgi:selenocysteine-specific elongation factor